MVNTYISSVLEKIWRDITLLIKANNFGNNLKNWAERNSIKYNFVKIIFGISQTPYAAEIKREWSPQKGSTTTNKHWCITREHRLQVLACFLVIGHRKIGDNAVQKTNLTPEPHWTVRVKISYLLSCLKVSFWTDT